MKNNSFAAMALLFIVVIGCKFGRDNSSVDRLPDTARDSNSANSNRDGGNRTSGVKKAYRISGTIDDASQVGDVCDASVKFKVPGTLEFEFTPTDATKGKYTYSGPFNASGSGPYEIRDDGTMLVDGTGCILGRCATYSHIWKAKPIDPATCKPRK